MTAGRSSVAGPLSVPVRSAVPTVGVEEEFFLLRPDGHTADVAPEVLGSVVPDVRAAAEFARCQVETRTGICDELSTVGSELATCRTVLARAALERGARLVSIGTPPVDTPGAESLSDDDRYRRLVSTVEGISGEEVTCASHVHVAVASRELGVAVLRRLRPVLPVLLALFGNSPLRRGRDTGWSSSRFLVQRAWPTFVPPPSCVDAADYDERVAALIATRAALDERGVYFWARLSPRYPTVEIRIADACLTVADVVLLAGLCRAAVMTAVADEMAGRPAPTSSDRVLVAAAYAAARRGQSAVVVDPWTGGWASVHAVLPRLMTALGAALDAAGDRQLVESLMVERLRRGSGADRQRARWRRDAPYAFVQAVVELGTGTARLIPRQSGVTSSASPWG